MKVSHQFALIGVGFVAVALATRRRKPTVCEYDTYAWSSRRGRAVDRESVSLPYNQIAPPQVSPDDRRCTMCEADQVWITLPGVEPFQVCWAYAPAIERALLRAMQQGAVIEKVKGYRPGRTGGPLDSQGRRTEYGHHAWGTALDINADQNGMYSRGRLVHGGPYRPDAGDPRTITHSSPIYQELARAGFVWAGDAGGSLRDWMHFSR